LCSCSAPNRGTSDRQCQRARRADGWRLSPAPPYRDPVVHVPRGGRPRRQWPLLHRPMARASRLTDVRRGSVRTGVCGSSSSRKGRGRLAAATRGPCAVQPAGARPDGRRRRARPASAARLCGKSATCSPLGTSGSRCDCRWGRAAERDAHHGCPGDRPRRHRPPQDAGARRVVHSDPSGQTQSVHHHPGAAPRRRWSDRGGPRGGHAVGHHRVARAVCRRPSASVAAPGKKRGRQRHRPTLPYADSWPPRGGRAAAVDVRAPTTRGARRRRR